MPHRRSAIPLAILAASALWGCGILRPPDMTTRREIAALTGPRRPLILIHGFLGSKLRHPGTHEVAWGTMANVLRGGDTDDLALALDDADASAPGEALEAYEIYDSLWGVDYYREILRSLRAAGGYQIGDIEAPRPGDNAFVFVYDWRRDISDSARRLADAIGRLKAARGDPSERFDLVAHSQGGLVARWYVKYGAVPLEGLQAPFRPTMAGAAHVGKVVLIGTPNRGCLESLKVLHRGIKKVFRPMRPEVVFTMPSVFQMLPPPGPSLFADPSGSPRDLDLYDPGTWVRQEWSVFAPEAQRRIERRIRKRDGEVSMERHNGRLRQALEQSLRDARRFQNAMEASAGGPEVDYHAFGGDCISTLKTAIVAGDSERPELHFDQTGLNDAGAASRLAEVLYGPGDGTVLMQSLLAIPDPGEPEQGRDEESPLLLRSAFFVCGSHGVLPNDPIFQNNLLYLLLWKDDQPGAGPRQPPHIDAPQPAHVDSRR
ncbi:MAG TPA: hypothetical protein VJV23_03505 [Candidatus Polarisedimenticolia bacterium]|nr:hypothetical protein [Candidatus Polarisedimenticolia bacterium]